MTTTPEVIREKIERLEHLRDRARRLEAGTSDHFAYRSQLETDFDAIARAYLALSDAVRAMLNDACGIGVHRERLLAALSAGDK